MMTKYIQNGDSLDYLNTTGKKILAGDIVSLATRIGVAGCDIAPDEVGSVAVSGVFEMPKTGTGEIPMGTLLFFDGTGITALGDAQDLLAELDEPQESQGTVTEISHVPAGYAAASAAADAVLVRVKLLG